MTPFPPWRLAQLARTIDTVFITPVPYRILNYLRSWAFDGLALAPVAAAAIWWARRPEDLPEPTVAAQISDEPFLLSHHMAQYFPTVIAVLSFAALLRAFRSGSAPGVLLHRAAVATTLGWSLLVVVVVVGGGLVLIFLPGGAVVRFAPAIVACGWAVVVRRLVYGRVRLRVPTGAGFLPPRRALLRRRDRRVIRSCNSAERNDADAVARAWAGFGDAIAAVQDPRLRAWCVAREVDYALRINALSDAERILMASRGDPSGEMPAVLAATGLFRQAIGLDAAAHEAFAEAARESGGGPARLRTLLLETASPEQRATATASWGFATRAGLVWRRQYAAVGLDLLTRVQPFRGTDPGTALDLAFAVHELTIALGERSMYADMSVEEARALQLVGAMALEIVGEIHQADGRSGDAVTAFVDAANRYNRQFHRSGRAAALLAATSAALRLNNGSRRGEANALFHLTRGLRDLEFDRGLLEQRANRIGLLRDSRDLYSAVLSALARDVVFYRDEAAATALWLMESIRRNALAAAIRRGFRHDEDRDLADLLTEHDVEEAQAYAADGPSRSPAAPPTWILSERLARLRGEIGDRLSATAVAALDRTPIDVGDLHDRLGARVALTYSCHEVDGGWHITTALTAKGRTRLSDVVLRDHEEADNPLRHPAGLLRALAGTDSADSTRAHRLFPMNDPGWRDLAEALLPPDLDEVMSETTATAGECVLLIVPDGPTAAVPFAGLRLPDGTALTERATIVFVPNLALVDPPATLGAASPGRSPAIVTHVGPTRFGAELAGLAAGERPLVPNGRPAAPRIIDTATRAELIVAIGATPQADLVAISDHGEVRGRPIDHFVHLRDRTTLSAAGAIRLRWPKTVVLGSCWSTRLTMETGDEPMGLVTACLLGGATSVVGGQAPIANRAASSTLARVALAAAFGEHPATALRAAVDDQRAGARDQWPPAAVWASLTVWSTSPPVPSRAVALEEAAAWPDRIGDRDPQDGLTRWSEQITMQSLLGSHEHPDDGPPPATGAMAPPPRPSGLTPAVLDGLLLSSVLLGRLVRKLARFGASVLVLALLAITIALRTDYNAPHTQDLLATSQPYLIAQVSVPGSPAPVNAVLLGSLRDFYTPPKVTGFWNSLRQVVVDGNRGPARLADQYAFALPSDGLPGRTGTSATLRYRGREVGATVDCAGLLSPFACIAVARLPGGLGPDGGLWESVVLTPEAPGPLLDSVYVLHDGSSPRVDQARAAGVESPEGATGPLLVVANPEADETNKVLTPVVLGGRDRLLPMLGLSYNVTRADWTRIVPTDFFIAYARAAAGREAGPPPGSVAYAGLSTAASSDGRVVVREVRPGYAADIAGIRAGDVIVAVDGARITSATEVTSLIQASRPGRTVVVDLSRDGSSVSVQCVLDYLPL
ncbi:hypothetical protein GCM10023194_54310 [Planotetraspora phitsanulokensis]|uniref:PDZ domain-containing protein n=1 Tax=Planotetraspora phitsanulokensis TaxID=575192 RepID=A0A8J3U1U0_9ACTN|nr:CHAT domain-containing protein [Planotetraspora phitsanulokensis]GII36685.1 hypothetical protein Pph01_16880 [Planotetraspora phitsanulokensis]